MPTPPHNIWPSILPPAGESAPMKVNSDELSLSINYIGFNFSLLLEQSPPSTQLYYFGYMKHLHHPLHVYAVVTCLPRGAHGDPHCISH